LNDPCVVAHNITTRLDGLFRHARQVRAIEYFKHPKVSGAISSFHCFMFMRRIITSFVLCSSVKWVFSSVRHDECGGLGSPRSTRHSRASKRICAYGNVTGMEGYRSGPLKCVHFQGLRVWWKMIDRIQLSAGKNQCTNV
jgi:hypothetical protein